jgi:hypothetical protein
MMKPPASLNVAPSRFVRTTIGPMTKVLNPLIRTVAGRRYMGMAALVYHTEDARVGSTSRRWVLGGPVRSSWYH